ncbi:unnamed protein product [Phytomonas sp. Hart1]|nr:unnamed protein product [Phytomonas sp. Hart1]|eukprot:CCW67667.1 unnamed protein product [Phytomonas sp. isolate Hart1]
MSSGNVLDESSKIRVDASILDMPPELRRLVGSIDVMAEAEASGENNAKSEEIRNNEPPPFPTPSLALLEQIDELYTSYTWLVEAVCRSLGPTAAPNEDEAEVIIQELKERVGRLQAGIRSKIHQTGRFALLNHLNSEVEKRQAALTRMESVLATAKRHL